MELANTHDILKMAKSYSIKFAFIKSIFDSGRRYEILTEE